MPLALLERSFSTITSRPCRSADGINPPVRLRHHFNSTSVVPAPTADGAVGPYAIIVGPPALDASCTPIRSATPGQFSANFPVRGGLRHPSGMTTPVDCAAARMPRR